MAPTAISGSGLVVADTIKDKVSSSQTLLAQRLVVADTMGAGLRPLDSSWSPHLGVPQSTCDLMLMTASEHYAAIEQQTSVS
jgi:hypothetical protein